jgi:hypothetical protein
MKRKKIIFNILRSAIRLMVVFGLAALLLFVQSSWAAAVCLCDHPGQLQQAESQHREHHGLASAHNPHESSAEVGHSAMHHEQAEHSEHHHPAVQGEQSQALSKDTSALISAEAGGCHDMGSQSDALICCHPQPKTDVSVASLSGQEPISVVDDLPVMSSGKPATFVPAKIPDARDSRPLYLTHSSLLI